jgi:hypothetical protein
MKMEIDNLQPPPQLLDSLSPKQHEAANHLAKTGRGIAWWKVGEGKTRIALAWMFYVVPDPRPLIICSPGAFRQWDDEIELLGLELKPKYLSYGMLSRRGQSLIRNFEKFNCVVIDELWLYKNYKSIRSHMIADISRQKPSIGLSGSMVTARNIEDLYGQARAMCLDRMISPNITSFRRDYCIEVLNYAGFIDRFPKKGAVEEIQSKIAKHVHVYFPEEQREIRNIDVHVNPTAVQLKVRHELVRAYYYEHQDKWGFKLEVKSAAALLIKLQQISDGFLRNEEGDCISIKSRKLFRLRELCAELLDAGERIIIWTAFRQSVNLLFKELPFPSVLLSGEHAFDAKAWHSGKANICIATVGSGASLNDFAHLGYAIFYSTRFSHVQVQQAKGRTNRASSEMATRYYYYLQTDGFPDADVLEMVEKSKQTEEMVICATNKIIANTLKNENVTRG